MFHVPEDKRAQRSAQKIGSALLDLMEEKRFHEITIQEVSKLSGISRVTFHRLFDSLDDVLFYMCHEILQGFIQNIQNQDIKGKILVEKGIATWMENERLLHLLTLRGKLGLLYQLFSEQATDLELLFAKKTHLTPAQVDYFVTLLSVSVPAIIATWIRHGKRESPAQVLESLQKSMGVIQAAFLSDPTFRIESPGTLIL